MARRAEKEKTPTQNARVPSQAQFDRLMKKLDSAASEMAESKGRMGSAIDQAISDYNLHKDAVRVVRKYRKKSPAQAAEFLLHLQVYWEYAALGDPDKDLLETADERAEDIRETIEGDKDGATRAGRKAAGEAMGEGKVVIRGGKVVPIEEAKAEEATAH